MKNDNKNSAEDAAIAMVLEAFGIPDESHLSKFRLYAIKSGADKTTPEAKHYLAVERRYEEIVNAVDA